MRAWLLIRLGMPLLVLFAVSVWLHDVLDADGFFLNLATEIIGIGVTVAYVDRVLRRHEAEEWGSVRSIIDGRIRLVANGGLTGVRSALGVKDMLGWDDLEQPIRASQYRALLRREFLPQLATRITELTQDGWKELVKALNQVSSETDIILRTFGAHLRASEYSTLLDIQENVRLALLTYPIETRLYGSDYKALAPSDVVANEFFTREAIREVGAVVQHLLSLGDLVSDEPDVKVQRRVR